MTSQTAGKYITTDCMHIHTHSRTVISHPEYIWELKKEKRNRVYGNDFRKQTLYIHVTVPDHRYRIH